MGRLIASYGLVANHFDSRNICTVGLRDCILLSTPGRSDFHWNILKGGSCERGSNYNDCHEAETLYEKGFMYVSRIGEMRSDAHLFELYVKENSMMDLV